MGVRRADALLLTDQIFIQLSLVMASVLSHIGV